ncbi:MAG: amidohydrolase family protein [Pseudomonadota bacterium]
MAEPRRTFAEWRAWMNQVQEAALEPELPICDPHHHLWLDAGHTGWPYGLGDFHTDTGSGHNVVQSVYIECHAEYLTDGPEHLRPVGETRFVVPRAKASAASDNTEIAAIVGHADLTLGERVEEVLAAHAQAGDGRFRGIRYITAQSDHPPLKMRPSAAMDDRNFLDGVRTLGRLGFSYDAMVYHPQLPALADALAACPDTPVVINHLGGFLGVGPYKDRRDAELDAWRQSMAVLAALPNTFLKVGGIGMPMMGFRWDKEPVPPTSETLASLWAEPIHTVIDLFGPERCMFESNYPVDGRGAGYGVLWNAFKRIAANYSPDEKRSLFHGTAARAYRIQG